MKDKKLIYVLDDCESTVFILNKWLSELFEVETFQTPLDFIERFTEKKPSLCILDVQLNAKEKANREEEKRIYKANREKYTWKAPKMTK